MVDVNKLIALHGRSKGSRSQWEEHWRQCYDMTMPQLGQGWAGVVESGAAQGKRAALLDATGTDAVRTLASTLVSGMTPANAQWLSLKVAGSSSMDTVDQYLAACSKIIWQNIHNANFDAEVYGCMLDFVITGSFVLFVDTDRERGGFHFEQWPLSECSWASSRGGLVDTLFREHEITAAQAWSLFGSDAGKSILDAVKDEPEKKFRFLHAIGPRKIYAAGGVTAKNMPYYSAYVNMTDKEIVKESGFQEFPCAVPRSTRIPGTEYATGVVSDALPDIKELNVLKEYQKKAAELAVSGMWIAEDDGVLNPRTVTVGPRKVIVANSVDSMKPLLTGSDFKVSFTTEERLQGQIRRVMMADQLTMQGSSQMTATEVNERMNLIRQQMGPIYGRLQAEYLVPIVERCFMLMLRAGILPTPPDELDSIDFHVHFDSPLARAQRQGEAMSIQQAIGMVAQFSQAIPGMSDNLDMDKAVREWMSAIGVPADIIRTSDDVEQGRQQQAAAQQAQQAQAMQDQLGMQNASEQISASNQPAA